MTTLQRWNYARNISKILIIIFICISAILAFLKSYWSDITFFAGISDILAIIALIINHFSEIEYKKVLGNIRASEPNTIIYN